MRESDPIQKLYSAELEQSCLSCLIIDGENFYRFALPPEAFYLEKNKIIFKHILKLIIDKRSFDFVALIESLKSANDLEKIGDKGYLLEVTGREVSGIYYETYAKQLYDLYLRREAYWEATKFVNRILNEGDAISSFNEFVSSVNRKIIANAESVPLSEILNRVYDNIIGRFSNPRKYSGFPYRMAELDKYTKGLHPDEGELVYIGGEPGIGKTVMALQMAINLAMYSNLPGVFYSLEMTAESLVERMVSYIAGVSSEMIDSGEGGDNTVEKIMNAFEVLNKLPLYIVDNSRVGINEIRADLNRRVSDGVRFFVLDYLQLVRGFESATQSKPEREALISRELRSICKDLKLGGIVLLSVLKEAMDGVLPSKKQVRGAGDLVHDADVILLIAKHQPREGEKRNNDMRTIIIDKNRKRRANVVFDMFFVQNGIMSFRDVERRTIDLNGYIDRKDIHGD